MLSPLRGERFFLVVTFYGLLIDFSAATGGGTGVFPHCG